MDRGQAKVHEVAKSRTQLERLFAGLVTCGMLLCPDTGSGGEPQLPVSHTTTSINN